MDPVDSAARVLNESHAIIASLSDADLARPTPCTSWNVRALVEHMIGVVAGFGTAFRGGQLTPPAEPGGTVATSAGLAATYRQAVDTLLEAARAPGALDKTITVPVGDMPAVMAIQIAQGDQLIHNWDLSKALGRPYTMEEPLAEAVLQMMHRLLPHNPGARGEGKAFADEIPCPPDAPVQDRLLAFAGRQP